MFCNLTEWTDILYVVWVVGCTCRDLVTWVKFFQCVYWWCIPFLRCSLHVHRRCNCPHNGILRFANLRIPLCGQLRPWWTCKLHRTNGIHHHIIWYDWYMILSCHILNVYMHLLVSSPYQISLIHGHGLF
jgi:hypothetical protein